jgi:hypothetical protein
MLYTILIMAAVFVLGAICGPAVHTAFAEAKVKVEAKYATQLAEAQTELAAVKLKATNDVMQAKLDITNDFNAMKSRAEQAESDLAALKRFLPSTAPAAAAAAAAAAPAPVPGASVMQT